MASKYCENCGDLIIQKKDGTPMFPHTCKPKFWCFDIEDGDIKEFHADKFDISEGLAKVYEQREGAAADYSIANGESHPEVIVFTNEEYEHHTSFTGDMSDQAAPNWEQLHEENDVGTKYRISAEIVANYYAEKILI